MTQPLLIGRSSSHFTRVARWFAAEAQVECAFRVVRNLLSCDPEDYGGNPALRLPSLRTAAGTWFGALNVCRELYRESRCKPRFVWPEQQQTPLLANAQELVLQAMSTEVTLVMSQAGGASSGSEHEKKMRASLANSIDWLETHLDAALGELPDPRDASYLELTSYCLLTHLTFRDVHPMDGYVRLEAFCDAFGARPASVATPYFFDP
jgi:hypothetical protein